MRRWYQTIEIPGVDVIFEDRKRKDSKFWNEGKWDNFIKPLLPKERQTFVEIGCNAGLFLKMAVDEGFKRVVGVDGNRQIIEQAKVFRNHNKGEYKLIHQGVGRDLKINEIPIADVVIIPNTHYYFSVGGFSNLVDRLLYRSLYCIVISAKVKRRQGNALYDLNSVRGYFRDWCEIKTIEGIDPTNDVGARPGMYGVLFKSNLLTLNIEHYYNEWFEASKNVLHKSHGLAPALEDFLTGVLDGSQFNHEDTDFYKYWVGRQESRKSEEWVKKFLIYKEGLAKDVQANGMREPIYLDKKGHLLDGLHRLVIAKLLGYKHIVYRRL